MRPRRSATLIAALALSIGISVWLYGSRPPLWIRHTLGDAAAAALVFALISLAWPRLTRWRRAGLALLVAGLTEGAQALALVAPSDPQLLHLTVGSTFDPLDLLAYALGVAAAAGLDGALSRRGEHP